MPFIGSVEGKMAFGRPSAPKVSVGGSLFFDGTANSNLSISGDIDFRNGTGDFTIEWFQYATTGGNQYPRLFSIGSYPGQSIAVSQEGSDTSRTFYAWISGGNIIESNQNYSNTWVYFALCRSGTNFRVFKNGTQIGTTLTNSTDFNDTTNALRIGNETTTSTVAAFKGYITNFRWTKGVALYTSNFTRPSAPLTASANTSLLLLATSNATASRDSSGKNKTVTNNSVAWNALSPF
jgi:Concanavalin A-like lectin/glucanases superfamily